MLHPEIIQGGMGAGVSNWRLARAVAQTGQLGVVSGTALAAILVRRLQAGDPGGEMRRAMANFPVPGVAARALADYFVPGGKPAEAPFKLSPLPGVNLCPELLALTVLANFVEVYLAKEGHSGPVGINFLEKIQFPTLPSIFGAMLGGVDYVLMGAGIPRSIPGVLDRLAAGEPVELKIDVEGALPGEAFHSTFDPAAFCGGAAPRLKRPYFLGIVASSTLAITLARKSNGAVDGLMVEGETAGGHNAPPRGVSGTECRWRTHLRPARPGGSGENPRTGTALLAGGLLWPARETCRSQAARRGGNSSRHRVRVLRGIRHPPRPQTTDPAIEPRREGPRVHRSAGLANGFSLQSGSVARHPVRGPRQ